MKVVIFGATGMVGQGVLRECLLDPEVELVETVGRAATGVQNAKLREIVREDLFDYQSIEPQLTGFDACFWCLGVSSTGMNEADYERVTYTMTMAAAESLARLNSQMTFVYVSGVGTDSTENGRIMWARIKGKTENALMRLPFRAVYLFRPGFIQPLHGIESRTPAYRKFYKFAKPLMPLACWAFPSRILTTEEIGRAMLAVVRKAPSRRILESADIKVVSRPPKAPQRDPT